MTDLDIARKIKLQPIEKIAEQLGISRDDYHPYGRHIAKLPLDFIKKSKVKKNKLILVTAVSPTPAGEGKTTTSIGLAQGLNRIGKQTTVVLREPSLGPVFGIKGGAAGGGWSQVLPMEDINLHFTGDFSAVEKAHNLLSALIDNNLQNRKLSLDIDPRTITWKRVMDMNDRALRNVTVGRGGTGSGIPRETGFDITAASEIMAILCLADDLQDLKKRFGDIFIGFTFKDRKPIYARDLKAEGAMTALMKDAVRPNLVQTIEGTPAIIHGGPFANIAQGTNSVIATRMGLSLSDYVVTEAGFGADLGAEKFLDIKCRTAGLSPHASVLVATIRALKYHGGCDLKNLTEPNPTFVENGLTNLGKHIENMQQFNVPVVVAINHFTSDSKEEVQVIKDFCESKGVPAVVSKVWADGGKGAEDLAHEVVKLVDARKGKFKPVYDLDWSVEKKIEAVATKIYGAGAVEFSSKAKMHLRRIAKLGIENFPICIAKTQKSFSDDPKKLGAPKGFTMNVREIEINTGARFLVPITGDMMRMPGLPSVPSAVHIDVNKKGEITGLF